MSMCAHIGVIETSETSVILEATLSCTEENSSRDKTRKLKVKSKEKGVL